MPLRNSSKTLSETAQRKVAGFLRLSAARAAAKKADTVRHISAATCRA